MFSIHTPRGVAFSGPLERLRQVTELQEPAAARPVAGKDLDGDELAGYDLPQKAIEEYQALLSGERERRPVTHTYQIMTRPVHALPDRLTLEQAWHEVERLDHSLLPIVDSGQRLVGSISRLELARLLLTHAQDPARLQQSLGAWSQANERRVIAADPVTDVRRVAAVLVEQQLPALPVVENRELLLGIISRTDILRAVITEPPLNLWC